MPAKKKPRLARSKSSSHTAVYEDVVKAVGHLGLAGGAEVLEHLRGRGLEVSKAGAFRHLNRAASAGELVQIQLGRARYYHPGGEAAMFLRTPRGLRSIAVPERLLQELRSSVRGLESAVVLVTAKI